MTNHTARRPRVSIIVAVGANGVIGTDGQLPWRLPEDLKRFRALTMGHAMVMGRKTFDSIGRPLPGRRSIVVSRQSALHIEGATVTPSLDAAIAAAGDDPEIFVIGGGEIYAASLPLADRLLVTEVDASPAGDTHFPTIDATAWREVSRERHATDDGLAYAFVDYERATPRS